MEGSGQGNDNREGWRIGELYWSPLMQKLRSVQHMHDIQIVTYAPVRVTLRLDGITAPRKAQ